MSDTIVVLNDGLIQQIGSPEDIYNEPRNRFVANFIGESNIVVGKMLRDRKVQFEGHVFDCVDRGFDDGEDVEVVIRPEDLEIVPEREEAFSGVVDAVTFKGVHYEIIVMVQDREYVIRSTKSAQVGETVFMTVSPSNIHVMELGGTR